MKAIDNNELSIWLVPAYLTFGIAALSLAVLLRAVAKLIRGRHGGALVVLGGFMILTSAVSMTGVVSLSSAWLLSATFATVMALR